MGCGVVAETWKNETNEVSRKLNSGCTKGVFEARYYQGIVEMIRYDDV